MKKRILMMLLAFVMVAGLMPVISTTASASASMAGGGRCYFSGEIVALDDINEYDVLQVGTIVEKGAYDGGVQSISGGISYNKVEFGVDNQLTIPESFEESDGVGTIVTNTGFWVVSGVDYPGSNKKFLMLGENENPQFTINFNTNGGSAVASITEDYNSTVEAPATTRTGFVFTGWATNSDGTGTTYAAGSNITLTDNMTLYAQWKHAHCICGAEHASVGSHTTPVNTEFANEISTLPELQAAATTGGNYYLTANIPINIDRDAAVDCAIGVQNNMNLCLNGFKITYNGPRVLPVFKVNSGKTLNITDCSEDEPGEIKTEVNNCSGIQNDGTVTIYGGTISGTTYGVKNNGLLTIAGGTVHSTGNSGIGNMPAGTVYVVGGEITGNNYGIRNGGIYDKGNSLGGGTVYISGGQVSRMFNTLSGEVTVSGTAEVTYILNRAILTVNGGTVNNIKNEEDGTATITGGNFPSNSLGAIESFGTLNLSGAPVISGAGNVNYDIYLHSALTVAGPLANATPYKVYLHYTMANTNAVVFAKDGADYIDKFIVKNQDYSIAKKGNDLEAVCHRHALCPGVDCSEIHSADHANKAFQPVTTQAELQAKATSGGSVYLANNIALTSTINVASGKTLNLCLNGKSVYYTGSNAVSIFTVEEDATLNITDCGAEPRVGHLDKDTKVWVEGTGDDDETALSLTGGIITGGTGDYGAVQNGGTLNLYAGNIAGNTRGVYNSGTFNMYGGTIAGNSSYGVWNDGDYKTFNFYDGKITYNTGWGLYIDYCNTVTMTGGEISHNNHNAAENTIKYGVYNDGIFTMSGGTINNHPGDGVYNIRTLTMSGGEITDNNCGVNNRNIFTMSGGKISDNVYGVSNDSDMFYVSGSPVIKDNTTANAYLCTSGYGVGYSYNFEVIGAFTNEADIGVTMETKVGQFAYSDGPMPGGTEAYFHSDEGFDIIAGTNCLKLGYLINEEPNADNGYTVTVSQPTGAKYQWHQFELREEEVTNASFGSGGRAHGTYDSQNGWSPNVINGFSGYFAIPMSAGDVLTVEFNDAVTGNPFLYGQGYGEYAYVTIEGNTYVFEPEWDDSFMLMVAPEMVEARSVGGGAPTLKATLKYVNEDPVDGQNNASLITDGLETGTYFCRVSWDLLSEYAVDSQMVNYTAPAPAPAPAPDDYDPTYPVVENKGEDPDGAVKFSSNYSSPGSTVTVTVTPDKYYGVEKVIVRNASGKEIQTTKNVDGTYSFKMPYGKVTVEAVYVWENPFVDVEEETFYIDAVEWALKNGITEGTSETTFEPVASCTRAQMVTFLWRAAGCPEPSRAVCDFTDVNMDSYYGKAVLWAVENGITNGISDTAFSPDMECSRAQMAAFLCRIADGKAESDENVFVDVKPDAYYADSVQWAVENGVTQGIGDNKFSPDAVCTRGQMVTFLYRYYA